MKYIYTLLILTYVTISSLAQSVEDPYLFSLNGHLVSPKKDLATTLRSAKLDARADQPVYVILQFKKLPTAAEHQQLKANGISLINYLQGNAYYALLKHGINGIKSKDSKFLRALIDIESIYKIDENLKNAQIPDFARGETGLVKVSVACFYLPETDVVKSELSSIGCFNIKLLPFFKSVALEIDEANLEELAKLAWVKNIQMISPPKEVNNKNGSNLHRTTVLRSTERGLGYGLTGKGVRIGVWDGDVENHRDFGNRVTQKEYEDHDSAHGTHVSGSIIGAGIIDLKAAGAAPEATIFSWNFNTQSNGLYVPEERLISLTDDSIEITSNSFGYHADICPNPFRYNEIDMYEDILASKFPYFLYVYSAGNSQQNCADGYYTTDKNLKSSLVVAAADKLNAMSSFSSFGPSYNGRLVPNITGDGVAIYSTLFDQEYESWNGTSMSTPGVAGAMALVYQRYKETHGGSRPLSSLMRALACNTASDFGNPGPDYKYGFGVLNAKRAVEVMDRKTYFSGEISQGEVVTKEIVIPDGVSELKVMMAWTDSAAMPGLISDLVNDLDLTVSFDGNEQLPWVLDPSEPSKNAIRGVDNLNVFEQVTFDNPVSGTYTIAIKGSGVTSVSQSFSVVYDVVLPQLQLVYPASGRSLEPENETVILWDCEGYTTPLTVEYSNDNGRNYSIIASGIPVENRGLLWKTPVGDVANAKIRISSGAQFSETKGSFAIMAVPQNVTAEKLTNNSFLLKWDSIPNSTYEVLKLNSEVYTHLAYVSNAEYALSNIIPSNDNYFGIRAIDKASGAISERSVAVKANLAKRVRTLPFYEDFESQKSEYLSLNRGNGGLRYINTTDRYGFLFEGNTNKTDWVDATAVDAFEKNSSYIVSAQMEDISLAGINGNSLFLTFDFRQKFLESVGTSFFRVKINGSVIPELASNKTIFGDEKISKYKQLFYDLTPYLSDTSLTITFEAVCKSPYETIPELFGDDDDSGDFVAIDNIVIDNQDGNIGVDALFVNSGEDSLGTIAVKVKNFSSEDVNNIPITISVNGNINYADTIRGVLTSLSDTLFVCDYLFDFSSEGVYEIMATVDYPSDNNSENDSFKTLFYTDYSVKMGVDTAIIVTSSVRFADSGGKYKDYTESEESIITFIPNIPNSAVTVTFAEFNTESDFDYLYLFDGASVEAPLIGSYSGSTLPDSFTSTALNGELTFAFSSDEGTEAPGWEATVSTILKPAKSIQLLSFWVANEKLGFSVKNLGGESLDSYTIFYQINSQTPVASQINSTLAASLSETVYLNDQLSFSATSIDTLAVWVEMDLDDDLSDNKLVDLVTNNSTLLRFTETEKVIYTSGVSFTDDGGAYHNYSANTTFCYSFIPNLSTDACRITFSSFNLEEDFDYLYIYNGTSDKAPLLGMFTGDTLPEAIISTAQSGALTFKFISDPAVTLDGWVAHIDMVTKPTGSTVDIGVSSVVAMVPRREHSSRVMATVKNFGPDPISNFEIAYRINGVSEVTQIVADTLDFDDEKTIAFSTLADLTTLDKAYNIDVYTKAVNDVDRSNDTINSVVERSLPSATNVVGHFNTSQNCIITDTAQVVDLRNNFTIEAWVDLSEPATYGYIFYKANFNFYYSNSLNDFYGANSYVLNVTTDSGDFILFVPNVVKFGRWQHIAISVNENNEYTLYINGVPQKWELYSGTIGAVKANGTYPLALGNRYTDFLRPINGSIDEVRLWNSALDSAAIAGNMMTDYLVNTPNLEAYYKFIQGNGEFIYDYSGNDNSAKLFFGDDHFWKSPGVLLSSLTFVGQKYPSNLNTTTGLLSVILDSADLTSVVANFETEMFSDLKISNVFQESGVTANNFENGEQVFQISGIGFNTGINTYFRVKVENDLNAACELNGVSFLVADNPSLPASIELLKVGDRFELKAPDGFVLTPLKAHFETSFGANVVFNSDIETSISDLYIDFTTPQIVTVYSQNMRNFKNYKVFLDARSDVAELLDFNISAEQINQIIINKADPFLNLWVKNSSQLSMLAPSFSVTPKASVYVKSIKQQDGISVNDFTNDVTYTIVSEDESSEFNWQISVKKDLEKPVISLVGDSLLVVTKGASFLDPGASATDNIDGDISSEIVASGTVDTEVAGSYTLLYSVTDAAGNDADQVTRTVKVEFGTSLPLANNDAVKLYVANRILFVDVPNVSGFKSLKIINLVGGVVSQIEVVNCGLTSFPLRLTSGVYMAELVVNDSRFVAKIVLE